MKNWFAAAVIVAALSTAYARADEYRDLYADTWVATDGLGRKLPVAPDVRPPQSDRFVGVFYFVWHGYHGTGGPYDITKLLAADPKNPKWGDTGAFHWWGEPEIGYFRDTDPWVARRNLEMLANAGVDTLFIDVTNAFTYPQEMKVLLETMRTMRAQGNTTPQFAFVMHANTVPTMQTLWNEWYKDGRYAELWFRWRGRPLILGDPDEKTKEGAAIPAETKNFFTWRRSWFETDPRGWFGNGQDNWAWRDRTPQRWGWHDDPKIPEQVAVGVASHPVMTSIGRSYKNNTPVKVDAYDTTTTYDQGIQFQEQWDRALQVDPQLVFVTGWNEWVAQRFIVAPKQSMNLAGRPLKEGDTFFVDLYNAEFSRDIDPMKGGYTDNYYYQLIANIRRYKGVRPLPIASAPKTIRIAESFEAWRTITPEYRDTIGDTQHRDFDGWGDLHYKNETGRNDIVAAKISRDKDNIYFYVRTAADLTPCTDPNWMLLLLDTDQNAATGWNGYEYRINNQRAESTTLLEKWNQGNWIKVAEIPYRAAKNELHLAIPRRLIKQTRSINFDFKWADNIDQSKGREAFFMDGDVAPPRRFNYRYKEK